MAQWFCGKIRFSEGKFLPESEDTDTNEESFSIPKEMVSSLKPLCAQLEHLRRSLLDGEEIQIAQPLWFRKRWFLLSFLAKRHQQELLLTLQTPVEIDNASLSSLESYESFAQKWGWPSLCQNESLWFRCDETLHWFAGAPPRSTASSDVSLHQRFDEPLWGHSLSRILRAQIPLAWEEEPAPSLLSSLARQDEPRNQGKAEEARRFWLQPLEDRRGWAGFWRLQAKPHPIQAQREKRDRLSDQMRALTQMARRFSHTINNHLTSLMAHLSMLQTQALPPDALLNVKSIDLAATQITRTLQDLSFFSWQPQIRQRITLRELEHSLTLLAAKQPLIVEVHPIAQDLTLDIEIQWLQEAFLYLFAFLGRFLPTETTLRITEEICFFHLHDKKGLFVNICFLFPSDERLSSLQKEEIFWPYLSKRVKQDDQGLAKTWLIVERLGGWLEMQEGTIESCLHCFLPVAWKERDEVKPEHPHRILLVDDQPLILQSISAILTRLGYESTAVLSGQEALALAKDALLQQQPFDLALIDLFLPDGIDGIQTGLQMRQDDPALQIILLSGAIQKGQTLDYEAFGFQGAMGKPFRMAELESLLKQCLRRPPRRIR
jgi:CheY-like chemotaxis protein